MALKPMNSTIELDFIDEKPARAALVFHGWWSPGRADIADAHYRCQAPDGVLWHVLSFGGDVGEVIARRLVHRVYDGFTKTIGLEP